MDVMEKGYSIEIKGRQVGKLFLGVPGRDFRSPRFMEYYQCLLHEEYQDYMLKTSSS